ncbi:hypothetical protein ACVWZZ_006671 [Bradyrhizobium sp. LM6.10]
MHQVEKRELFDQGRKIFEAGVQRADKRSGSFSFLTWSFFIAPLIACEEFLAAPFKSALAEQEDATAARAGAGPQATNDELPASDPAKPRARRMKGPKGGPPRWRRMRLSSIRPGSWRSRMKTRPDRAQLVAKQSPLRAGGMGAEVAKMPIFASTMLTPRPTLVASIASTR